MSDFKGYRFARDIILVCVRWYLAYPLTYRNLRAMMTERGVEVTHSNIYRWVQKCTPELDAAFPCFGSKRPLGQNWRMDETYIALLHAGTQAHIIAIPACGNTSEPVRRLDARGWLG